MTDNRCVLVLGGAASGKSAFAERLLLALGRPCLYIATAEAGDAEMAARIARHRSRRGPAWTTVDAPLAAARALAAAPADHAVLFDGATLWLSNHLLAGHDPEAETEALARAVSDCPAPLVIVSDEVGHSIVPGDPLSRRFRDGLGVLNQRLAAQADAVALVTAGLPQWLKGAP